MLSTITLTLTLTHNIIHMLDHCILFESEPLLWLAGLMGFQGPKLSQLTVLDLSSTPVDDKGLTAVSTCNRKLKYLNLNGGISDMIFASNDISNI